jgi:hypothetical protein
MAMLRWAIGAGLGWLVVACASGPTGDGDPLGAPPQVAPKPAHDPEPQPERPKTPRETSEPPATPQAAVECQLVLRAQLRPDGGPLVRRLSITAENVGVDPLEVSLPDRCPQGPIALEGLGEGYDYYRTCNAGACSGPRPSKRVSLPPGATKELASTTVHLRGAPPCTEALTEGRYRIVPVAPALEVSTCVIGAVLQVPALPMPAPRTQRVQPKPEERLQPKRPQERRQPKRPPPKAGDPYACEQPSDCVLSCPGGPKCCGWPCGCRHAIHRDHKAAFEAQYPDTCTKHPDCPAVACIRQQAVGATCRNGRCVGVTSPTFF